MNNRKPDPAATAQIPHGGQFRGRHKHRAALMPRATPHKTRVGLGTWILRQRRGRLVVWIERRR